MFPSYFFIIRAVSLLLSANYADNMKTFDYGWTKTDKETGPVAQTKDFMQSKKKKRNKWKGIKCDGKKICFVPNCISLQLIHHH